MGGTMILPTWQVCREKHPFQPHANEDTRSALMEKLLNFQPHDLVEAGDENPEALHEIVRLIGTRGTDIRDSGEEESDDENRQAIPKRRLAAEGVMTMLVRNINQTILNFLAAVLSLLALTCGVAKSFWAILNRLGILFSKPWTVQLARDLGTIVEGQRIEGEDEGLGMVVADNKCYSMKPVFKHAKYNDSVWTQGDQWWDLYN